MARRPQKLPTPDDVAAMAEAEAGGTLVASPVASTEKPGAAKPAPEPTTQEAVVQQTETQDPQEETPVPVRRGRGFRKPAPDEPRTADPRERMERPDPRERMERPDPRERMERPDPRDTDPRERPDPRMRPMPQRDEDNAQFSSPIGRFPGIRRSLGGSPNEEMAQPAQIRSVRDHLSKSLTDNERVKAKFKFRQKRPGRNGSQLYAAVGDFQAVGENWKERIAYEVAKSRGPGEYEGIAHTHDGKLIPGEEPWALEITEEEASLAGWVPQTHTQEETNVPIALSGSVAASPSTPTASTVLDEEMKARKEKANIEYLKARCESAKLEKDLARIQSDGAQDGSLGASTTEKPGMSEDTLKKIIDAEKGRVEAENKVLLAEAEARRISLAAEADRKQTAEVARVKSEAAEDRRKSDELLRGLREELTKREETSRTAVIDLQRSFESKLDKLVAEQVSDRREAERDRAAALAATQAAAATERPKAEKQARPEDYANAIAAVLAPLATGLSAIAGPVVTALMAKMSETPQQPDQMKQMTGMADIISKLMPKQEQPKQDAMEMTARTLELVRTALPPPIRPEDIAAAVTAAMGGPRRDEDRPQSQMAFTADLLQMVRQVNEISGPRAPAVVAEPEERPDVFEQMIETKERFERLGIPVSIGQNGEFGRPPEPPKSSVVREVIEGVRDALPAVGAVLAQYNSARQPQVDPELLKAFQLDQMKKRQAAAQARQGRKHQAQPGQQPRQPQRPLPPDQTPVVQRQPQPRPQQPRPQQPATTPAEAAAINQRAGIERQNASAGAPRPANGAPQTPATTQTNRFVPPTYEESANGLPVVAVQRRTKPAPGFVPTEALPRTADPKKAPELPVVNLQARGVVEDTDRPGPFHEEIGPDGLPSAKTWGELSRIAVGAIAANANPDDVAIILLERFPKSAGMVVSIGSSPATMDSVLVSLAGQAGAYAEIVGELASKTRSDPGKTWIASLIKSLMGSPVESIA